MNITTIETHRGIETISTELFQDSNYSTLVNYSKTELEGIDYFVCQDCGQKLFFDTLTEVETDNGENKQVCQHCLKQKYFFCVECNTYYSVQCQSNELQNGDYVCDHCFDNYYFICNDCEGIFHCDDSHHTKEGAVCESCLENYSYCECCEEYHKDDETTVHWKININRMSNSYHNNSYYIDRIVCNNCLDSVAFYCNGCQEYFSLDHFNPINVQGDIFCDSCSENYCYCDNCNEYFPNNDMRFDENSENYYCTACYQEQESTIVHDSSYEPTFYPLTKKENREKIGFELEVDNVSSSTMEKCFENNYFEINEEFYLKTDGSIPNGIEIVSQPFSYNYFREHKKDFKSICDSLSKAKATSYDSGRCGLHIHISRESLSGIGLYKALTFFRKNASFILGVSFRSEDRLNHWAEIDSDYYRNIRKAKQRIRNIKDTYSGKCCAINLEHSYSYEFRIFAGTLNSERVIASIQFIISFCEFCMQTSLQKLSKNDYLSFLSKTNKSQYRELKSIMPKMLKKGGF